MEIGALVDEFIALREAGGLFLGRQQVVGCAIEATRLFAGWAELVDPAAADLDGIVETVDVTASEWAIIKPLFLLYVERETATVVENSRSMGIELPGRSSSEVSNQIQQYEAELPQLAFVEPAFAVGYPPV